MKEIVQSFLPKSASPKNLTDAPIIKQVRSALIHHVFLFRKRHYRQPFAFDRSVSRNISNTIKRVSSDIQTLRSRLKKRGAAEFFFNDFEVFGYLMKHTFECLIWLLK